MKTAKEKTATWGWSHSDEEATGEDEAGSTREEAIAEAIDTGDFGPGDTFWTFRKEPADWRQILHVSGSEILEALGDAFYEEGGEVAADRLAEAIEADRQSVADLTQILTDGLRAWFDARAEKFKLKGWWTMEDCESYTVPAKDEAA